MTLRHQALILCLIPLLLLWRVVGMNQSLCGGDLINSYIPVKSLVVEEVKAGEFPHWNPLMFCGRPLQGDIETGIFYPPNLIFLWVQPALGFDLLVILHYMLFALGALLFFNALLQAPWAALISSLALCFLGFFVTQLHSGIVLFLFVGAWLPWGLWAIETAVTKRRVSGFFFLILFASLQLLAGAPQITFMCWILSAIYLVTILLMEYRGIAFEHGARQTWKTPFGISPQGWKLAGGFALAFIMVICLTAIQWMPTREFMAQSFDRARGASWEYVTNGSFEWRWLPTFLFPFIYNNPANEALYWGGPVGYWEFNGYLGIVPFALALVGMSALRRRNQELERRLAVFSLGCIIAWLLLAPGSHSIFFKTAYYIIPGMNRFRVPARWVLAYQLGMAGFAGLGFKAIFVEQRQGAGKAFLIILALLFGIEVALAGSWRALLPHILAANGQASLLEAMSASPQARQAFEQHWKIVINSAGAAIALLAVALLAFALRKQTALAITLLLALIVADVLLFSQPLIQSWPRRTFQEHFYRRTPLVKALQDTLKPGERFTWDDPVFYWTVDQNQEEIYPNRPVLYQLPMVRGYDPMNSLRFGQFSNVMGGLPIERSPGGFMFMPEPASPRLLALLNTRVLLSYQPLQDHGFTAERSFAMKGDPLQGAETLNLSFFSGEDPVGSAFLARPMPVADPEERDPLLMFGILLNKSFHWREYALVEAESLPPAQRIRGYINSVKETGRGYNWREFHISAPERMVLVLSESYFPGWKAEVDGRKQETMPADWALVGTLVEPGIHDVRFYYQPSTFTAGRTVSLISIAALAFIALILYRDKLKGTRALTPPSI